MVISNILKTLPYSPVVPHLKLKAKYVTFCFCEHCLNLACSQAKMEKNEQHGRKKSDFVTALAL